MKIYHTGEGRGGKRNGLVKILFFEIGIVLKQFPAIHVSGEDFQDLPNCNAHAADTRVAAHFARLDGDAVKWLAETHTYYRFTRRSTTTAAVGLTASERGRNAITDQLPNQHNTQNSDYRS